MKKILGRIFTVLILPLLFIGTLNYFIDPDYVLQRNYISALADFLTNGKLVSGPVNVNSRALKKQCIEKMTENPEILVLGSSRTLSLSKKTFPGKKIYNASVTNCTFQDMYSFLNLFDKKSKRIPETIIICVDQWLFNDSFNEKRWLANREDFVEMLKKTSNISEKQFPAKWELQKEWVKELFSVRYLIRSLTKFGKTEKFEICDSVNSGKMMLLPDGSRLLSSEFIDLPEDQITKRAQHYFYSSQDEYFDVLSSFQCQLFENLIDFMKRKQCQIILFLPPYHPAAFQLFKHSEKTTGIFKAENYIRNIALKKQIKIIDCTDPACLNLTSADFYDAVHLQPKKLDDIFTVLQY